MRILVTNDDGVDAPGLAVLAGALRDAGHDVFVVAPKGDRSGSGAALGRLWDPPAPAIDVVVWPDHPELPVAALDAPPAAAVLGAVLGAFGPPPELVVAGINPGANTGHLVIHSGTVGAALTAAGLDLPGIAVSLTWSETGEWHWDTAAAFAVAAIDWVTTPGPGIPRVLNVNVPNRPLHELRGVREAELAPHGEVWVASADASQGDLRLHIRHVADAAAHTDVAILQEGYVAVTPLVSVARAALAGAGEALATVLSVEATPDRAPDGAPDGATDDSERAAR